MQSSLFVLNKHLLNYPNPDRLDLILKDMLDETVFIHVAEFAVLLS